MPYKYTAKIYLSDGEILLNSGDDVEHLSHWLRNQMETAFDYIKCEIVDNEKQTVIKNFQYTPPDE